MANDRRKKSSVGLPRLLRTMSDICKVSDGKGIVDKYVRIILIPCFGAGCVWGWKNILQTVRLLFLRKQYTTLALNES
jgi:hypothetical protein